MERPSPYKTINYFRVLLEKSFSSLILIHFFFLECNTHLHSGLHNINPFSPNLHPLMFFCLFHHSIVSISGKTEGGKVSQMHMCLQELTQKDFFDPNRENLA
jgi:hypothetical protein